MHAFAQLRNDVDLNRIWMVTIGLTVLYTVMNLAYGEYINGWMFLRGTPETALAMLAAGGRRWARVVLGVQLAFTAAAAGFLWANGPQDLIHQFVHFTYASGTGMAAAKALRLI